MPTRVSAPEPRVSDRRAPGLQSHQLSSRPRRRCARSVRVSAAGSLGAGVVDGSSRRRRGRLHRVGISGVRDPPVGRPRPAVHCATRPRRASFRRHGAHRRAGLRRSDWRVRGLGTVVTRRDDRSREPARVRVVPGLQPLRAFASRPAPPRNVHGPRGTATPRANPPHSPRAAVRELRRHLDALGSAARHISTANGRLR